MRGKANRLEIAASVFYWAGNTMLLIGLFVGTNKLWIGMEALLFLISTILYRWLVTRLREA